MATGLPSNLHIVDSDLASAFAQMELEPGLALPSSHLEPTDPGAANSDPAKLAADHEALHHLMLNLRLDASGLLTSDAHSPTVPVVAPIPCPKPRETPPSQLSITPNGPSPQTTPSSSKRRRKASSTSLRDPSELFDLSSPHSHPPFPTSTSDSYDPPTSAPGTPPTTPPRSRHGHKLTTPFSVPTSPFKRPKLPHSPSSGSWIARPPSPSPSPPSSPPAPVLGRYASSPTPRVSPLLPEEPVASASAGKLSRRGGRRAGDDVRDVRPAKASAAMASALAGSALLMRGGGGVRPVRPVKVRRIASCPGLEPRVEGLAGVRRSASGMKWGTVAGRSAALGTGRGQTQEVYDGDSGTPRGTESVDGGGEAMGEAFVQSLGVGEVGGSGGGADVRMAAERDGMVWMVDSLANNVYSMRLC